MYDINRSALFCSLNIRLVSKPQTSMEVMQLYKFNKVFLLNGNYGLSYGLSIFITPIYIDIMNFSVICAFSSLNVH